MLISIYNHKVFLNLLATVSLMGNGLLLFLLTHPRSKVLGNYRYLLASFALTDILVSLYHSWYIPIILLGNYGYVFFGNGALSRHGEIARHSVIIYTIIFYMPFYVLCMHFIYRFLSLSRPTIVRERFSIFMLLYGLVAIVYIFFIGVLIFFAQENPAPPRFRHFLAAYGITPELEHLNYAAINLLDANLGPNYRTIAIFGLAGCLGGGPIAISVVCIWKIMAVFRNRFCTVGQSVSNFLFSVIDVKVRRMHVQLFRALLIQFAVPILFSLLPFSVIVFLPMIGDVPDQIGNVCGMIVSVFPALDPLLVIVSLSSFRTIIRDFVDVLFGRTGRRNEKKEKDRSRIYRSMIKSMTNSM